MSIPTRRALRSYWKASQYYGALYHRYCSMSEQKLEETQRLVRSLISEHQEGGWEEAWKIDATPWDRTGNCQPPLLSLLRSSELDWPREGRALVPGCGRGYDTILIAATLNLRTIGIDISQTGIDAAQKLLDEKADAPKALIQYRSADFFSLSTDYQEQFDLIYDYTFFVAIPPSRRPEWAHKMGSIAKPGAFLITLVYPILPYREFGPPFHVQPEHYTELLSKDWDKVIDRTPVDSQPSHVGKEHLFVWRRRSST